MTQPHQPTEDQTANLATKMARLGRARSPEKTQAARKNGKLGGWTKGRRLSDETRRKISETKRRQMLDRLFPPT